jgi:hypothetical protein
MVRRILIVVRLTRRIIDYLLSPLLRHAQESLRER